MFPDFNATCPIAHSMATFDFCLSHESDGTFLAPTPDMWLCAAYVSWRCLDLAWSNEEEGFLSDDEWADKEGQLWVLLGALDSTWIRDAQQEFEYLATFVKKAGIPVGSLNEENASSPSVHTEGRSPTAPPAVSTAVPVMNLNFCGNGTPKTRRVMVNDGADRL
ncbi:hypothetical protein EDD18DRAFT_1344456 [Armillaria luteobubalina]|uniref:Uncharacterized protein n=1 Tax=Armillaria luteobubalina TaxID=153913 RepID=A0AA39QKQ2_9AGAR|nr:hypothetical protein EDD18DRAFT_1344456 [Armillaria luteobubalina]